MKLWKTEDKFFAEYCFLHGGIRMEGLATIPMPIKKKWFDMIKSGKKTEEYRSMRWYQILRNLCEMAYKEKRIACIELINGYGANRPRIIVGMSYMEVRPNELPPRHPEWGEPSGDRVVIGIAHVFKSVTPMD